MQSRIIVLIVMLFGAPSIAHSFEFDLEAHIFFSTTGTGNPYLTYHFDTQHSLTITKHNLAETAIPVQMVGTLARTSGSVLGGGGTGVTNCSQVGTVGNLFFFCRILDYTSTCPAAEATWFAQTAIISSLGGGASSGPVIANCPPSDGPNPCGSGAIASFTTAIDLESGLTIDRSLSLKPARLTRSEVHGGKEYILGEWEILAVGPEDHSVESASAEHRPDDSSSWANTLRQARVADRPEAPGSESGQTRYLVVQGMQHQGNLRRPLVKLHQRLVEPDVLSPGERLVIRATFSASGRLESVETIEGSAATAEVLSEALELEFVPGSEHRVSLYAVFEGLDRPELVSAVPFFLQCCCGETFCI